MTARQTIESGKAILGIEFGSTRIKAVLIDQENKPIAQGSHEWENQLVDGLWTYSTEAIWYGVEDCYADLRRNVKREYDCEIEQLASIGISAMMHGYMAFGPNGKATRWAPVSESEKILAPFRTWRNTNTGKAAAELSKLFNYNIPLRWSISHLYQAILNGEEHVKDITYLTTLAGYIHWRLTDKKVLGIGDASGMIPVDPNTKTYNAEMVRKFNELVAPYGFPWKLEDILPECLVAGQDAGVLTEHGAQRLDVSGHLKGGCPLCPPEGDAGTGMTATNSVKVRTGNVSAPDGNLVAMVHCNNCTSDINAWVKLFKEYQELLGVKVDMNEVYAKLYNHALTGDVDCGGVISYNFISGEPVAGLTDGGRPLVMRSPNDRFNLANFMRANLYATIAVLKLGNDVLFKEENVKVDRITGHGGLFKTPGVGQKVLAAALNSPISVMETAGEGGAWGIALLAAYLVNNPDKLNLADYLEKVVFAGNTGIEIAPEPADVEGFNRYIETYKACIPVDQAAVEYKK